MELHLQKNTSISLHQQLVTQISMQIAAGTLRPGEKLPSIRALAKRLDVHHNTCLTAYKHLDEVGLIELKHGSGARVAVLQVDKMPELPFSEGLSLATLADFMVQQSSRAGFSPDEVFEALKVAYQQTQSRVQAPLIFVDIHLDILPVFQVELEQALHRLVKTKLLERLSIQDDGKSHFIVSRYHCEALHQKLKTIFGDVYTEQQLRDRVTVIDVGSVQQELNYIKTLPENAMISVISASSIILQQAEAVIKALRGEEIIIRTVLYGQESQAELQRILKRAQANFADKTCLSALQSLTSKPVHDIQIVPSSEIKKLVAFAAD